jgi:hypothetical protein
MALHASVKHVEVNKAETSILATVAIGVVITIFSLFGIKSQLSKISYNQRVLNAKHQAAIQLKDNLSSAKALADTYQTFAAQDPNVLGGKASGQGNLDGTNAQIALDALPSTYDAPALASTIEKILNGENVSIHSILVKDDPAGNPDQAVSAPVVHPIPFSFSDETSYSVNQNLLKDFERSIRPFNVQSLTLSGSDKSLSMQVNLNTYFQPPKSLSLSNTKAVK